MTAERLGIAGIGLIGGSIALRAREVNPQIVITGYDGNASALAAALAHGVIDVAVSSLAEAVAGSDTLVIALPVDATDAALDALAGYAGPTLILDVASVKALLARHAERVPNYIGTHPMAGRERSGIEAADRNLFLDATWAYTPHANAALVDRTRAFIASMGARPVEIEANGHDEIVALTSHLPQALSVILGSELAGAAASNPHVMELCGPGITSMLRLARSPEAMWSPIFKANAVPVRARLRSIARALERAAAALEEGDGDGLASYFRAAREASAALEQRNPAASRSPKDRCSQPPSTHAPPPSR